MSLNLKNQSGCYNVLCNLEQPYFYFYHFTETTFPYVSNIFPVIISNGQNSLPISFSFHWHLRRVTAFSFWTSRKPVSLSASPISCEASFPLHSRILSFSEIISFCTLSLSEVIHSHGSHFHNGSFKILSAVQNISYTSVLNTQRSSSYLNSEYPPQTHLRYLKHSRYKCGVITFVTIFSPQPVFS